MSICTYKQLKSKGKKYPELRTSGLGGGQLHTAIKIKPNTFHRLVRSLSCSPNFLSLVSFNSFSEWNLCLSQTEMTPGLWHLSDFSCLIYFLRLSFPLTCSHLVPHPPVSILHTQPQRFKAKFKHYHLQEDSIGFCFRWALLALFFKSK